MLNVDCAVIQIISPVSGPGLTEAKPVIVVLINYVTDPVFEAHVSYSIDGGLQVVEWLPILLFPGEPVTYTFLQLANLNIPGQTSLILAFVTAPGNEYPANACLTMTYQNETPVIYQLFNYQYDPAGNIVQAILVNEGPSIIDFNYSARNELLSEAFIPSGNLNLYTYKPTGQRASVNKDSDLSLYSSNSDGVLISAGAIAFIPDANGNRISMIEEDEITVYSYGYENELVHVTLPDLSYIHFDYSALLLKLRENDNGNFRYLHTDNGMTLEAIYFAGKPVNYCNPGLSINQGSSRGFYFYNGFASSTLQLDPPKNIHTTTKYDAFGNAIVSTGAWIDDRSMFRSWNNYNDIGFQDLGRGIHSDPAWGNEVNRKGRGIDPRGMGHDITDVKPQPGKNSSDVPDKHGAEAIAKGYGSAIGGGGNPFIGSPVHIHDYIIQQGEDKAGEEPGVTKPGVVTEGNPETAQKSKNEENAKKKGKCCRVKTFEVKWSESTRLYFVQLARIDVKIEFEKNEEYDPAGCLYCENAMTKAEIADVPNKGLLLDTSPMHDNYASRAYDTDNQPVPEDPLFLTDSNPGKKGINPNDELDFTFTSEQMVKEGCGPPCPTGSVIAKRGRHSVKVTGKDHRKFEGIPIILDK